VVRLEAHRLRNTKRVTAVAMTAKVGLTSFSDIDMEVGGNGGLLETPGSMSFELAYINIAPRDRVQYTEVYILPTIPSPSLRPRPGEVVLV